MKVWITKYALTSGIQEREGDDCGDGMIQCHPIKEFGYTEYFHGKDWHTSHASAVTQAQAMRLRKILSLEKNIERLKALTFS